MEYSEPTIINVGEIADARGNLSVLECPGALPFTPVRVYWIYDVPTGRIRYGHAHYVQYEVITALSGSFEVHVRGTWGARTYRLSKPWEALYLPAMTWREIDSFSSNSVALVLSSGLFDESDYIRDLDLFNEIISADV